MNTARTSLFLMANLGAEVSRIISAVEHSNDKETHSALDRALHMLNQLKSLPEMIPRAVELDALAGVLRSLTAGDVSRAVSSQHLKSYFTPFALRLMASRT